MATIYVSTYAKYNAGNLEGEWLDPENYTDKADFLEACAELHKDEDDPELMFQDSEGIPDFFISESYVDPGLWDYLAFDGYPDDAKEAYIACFNEWDERDFRDRYRGEFESWEAMAEEFLEETGELSEIPERLRYYFDYEKYARDLRIGGDMCEYDGHFFWNN